MAILNVVLGTVRVIHSYIGRYVRLQQWTFIALVKPRETPAGLVYGYNKHFADYSLISEKPASSNCIKPHKPPTAAPFNLTSTENLYRDETLFLLFFSIHWAAIIVCTCQNQLSRENAWIGHIYTTNILLVYVLINLLMLGTRW